MFDKLLIKTKTIINDYYSTVRFKNSPTERNKATWTPTEEIWKRYTQTRVGFNFLTNHHCKDGGQDGGSTPSALSARVRPSSTRYIINQMIDILISNSYNYDDMQWLPNCSYLSNNHSCPRCIYIIWRIEARSEKVITENTLEFNIGFLHKKINQYEISQYLYKVSVPQLPTTRVICLITKLTWICEFLETFLQRNK